MTSRDADPSAARPRVVAVDMLKGCAAVWVPLIHAEVLAGQPLMTQLINRAAQLFVILIGLNASLWWRARGSDDVATWYANRFRRLYPPMWAAVACWWVIALWTRPPRIALSPGLFAAHLCGYLVGIGTGWFVSYAIAAALLLPAFVWALRRIGARALFVLGIASSAASFFLLRDPILGSLGMFAWLVFPPRLFAHLAFGFLLAEVVARLGTSAVAWSLLALGIYYVVPALVGVDASWDTTDAAGFAQSNLTALLHVLTDLPVCVLLLVALGMLRTVAPIATPLAWLGNESYAIYLGQMALHNAIAFAFGFHRFRDSVGAWGYAAILLAGALAWVLATRALRGARLHRAKAQPLAA